MNVNKPTNIGDTNRTHGHDTHTHGRGASLVADALIDQRQDAVGIRRSG